MAAFHCLQAGLQLDAAGRGMEVVVLDGTAIDVFKLADQGIGVAAMVAGMLGVQGANAVPHPAGAERPGRGAISWAIMTLNLFRLPRRNKNINRIKNQEKKNINRIYWQMVRMSAFGVRADRICCRQKSPLIAKSGHWEADETLEIIFIGLLLSPII